MTRVSRRMVPWGAAADGGALAFPLIEVQGDGPGPTGVFTGGIHGDEYEGPLALMRLAETLEGMALKGRVLIVPFANGPALNAGRRVSPIDGVNLARVFPGAGGDTASYRLARALFGLLDRVDFLFDSHAGGIELNFIPVAGFYGPGAGVSDAAAAASLALARATGLADLWRLPPVPGVLSYEAARRGITVTGCEIGGRGHALPADVDTYHAAYLGVLAAQGMIDRPLPATNPRILHGNWITAPVAGILEQVLPAGSPLAPGDLIARVRGPLGEVLHEFRAEAAGKVMAERNLCSLAPGDLAVCPVTVTA